MANIFNTIYEIVEKGGFQFDDAFREYNVFSTLGILNLGLVIIGSIVHRAYLYYNPKKRRQENYKFFVLLILGLSILNCILVAYFSTRIFLVGQMGVLCLWNIFLTFFSILLFDISLIKNLPFSIFKASNDNPSPWYPTYNLRKIFSKK